jgi:hypothetical protein
VGTIEQFDEILADRYAHKWSFRDHPNKRDYPYSVPGDELTAEDGRRYRLTRSYHLRLIRVDRKAPKKAA